MRFFHKTLAFCLVIASAVMTFTACNSEENIKGNMSDVLSRAEESSNESYTHPRDENNNYGYSIGYCGDIPTEYNGKELTLDI